MAIRTSTKYGPKIPRSLIGADAIDGTKIADDSVDSEHLAAASVNSTAMSGRVLKYTDAIAVSSAELLALAASPKTIVAAPGAGYALVLAHGFIEYIYGATAYTITAGGDDMALRYKDGTGALCSVTLDTAGFIDQVVNEYRTIKPLTTDVVLTPNEALVLDNIGANEWTQGDGTLNVHLWYRIVVATV